MTRKESQRQSKAKVAATAKPRQRRSKEKESSAKKPTTIEVEDNSPSGEILSSQDSLEESSASSQDSLQSTRFVYFTVATFYEVLWLNSTGKVALVFVNIPTKIFLLEKLHS